MAKKESTSPTIRTELRLCSSSFIPAAHQEAQFFYVRAIWTLRNPTGLFVDTSYVEKRVIENEGLGQHHGFKRFWVPAQDKCAAIEKLEEQALSDSLQEYLLIRAVIKDAVEHIIKMTT